MIYHESKRGVAETAEGNAETFRNSEIPGGFLAGALISRKSELGFEIRVDLNPKTESKGQVGF